MSFKNKGHALRFKCGAESLGKIFLHLTIIFYYKTFLSSAYNYLIFYEQHIYKHKQD